ncbi:MAG: hypothetical protein ACTSRE_06725 [Promethearchaeota archaeon]
MINQQKLQKINNLSNKELGYDYIEIEYILEEKKGLKKESEQDGKKQYALSSKISRKELRKDRRSRQKSWIEIKHKESEYSIADWRISR